MADQVRPRQESMYCHACHHQWQRQGEGIECPACNSASTEIITPENDPRYFHNRQPEQATSSTAEAAAPSAGPEGATAHPARSNEPSGNEARNSGIAPQPTAATGGNTPHSANGHRVTFMFRFTGPDAPPITFITFMTSQTPPPPTENLPPVTFFGVHFPSGHSSPSAPPPTRHDSSPAETDGRAAPQPQQSSHPDGQQQPPPQTGPQPAPARGPQPAPTGGPQPAPAGGPQPAPTGGPQPAPAGRLMPSRRLAAILSPLLDPANAVVGDAVYSQEALDRVISQLREQMQPSGAPPASQAALDRLQTKELDDQMLGGCGDDSKAQCVVCVEDMAKGAQAAVLPCSHFFHGECVMPWLKQHNTCPVCRRSVEVEADEAEPEEGVDVGAAAPEPARTDAANDAANDPDSMDCP